MPTGNRQAQRDLCVQRNTKHNLSKRGKRNRYYVVWLSIKNRCYNPRCADFKDYGAKGITVSPLWRDDPAAFVQWCEEQPKPPRRALLDRRDGAKGYSPENCHFISDADSVRNRSMSIFVEVRGMRLVLKDAVEKFGLVSYSCAKSRIRERGWSPVDAVLTPANQPR